MRRAWWDPFTTRSDFSRENAELVAMAAVDGLISTKIASGLYGNKWFITEAGIRHYKLLEGWE